MPSFEELFAKSKGKPILYQGRTIQMADRFSIVSPASARLIFESVNSEWRQGVSLETDGHFGVNGKLIANGIVLWQNTAPKEVRIQITAKDDHFLVKNVWDRGDGTIDSWHNGAAMIVQEGNAFRRYFCNDGHPDDNFDDLVFRLEIL